MKNLVLASFSLLTQLVSAQTASIETPMDDQMKLNVINNIDLITLNEAGNTTATNYSALSNSLNLAVKKYNNTSGMIKWATQTEENCAYFMVMRSENGQHYKSIAHIDAVGNSDHLVNYFTVDANIENESYYYRIIQVDQHGSVIKIANFKAEYDQTTLNSSAIYNTIDKDGKVVNENYRGKVFDLYIDGKTLARMQ